MQAIAAFSGRAKPELIEVRQPGEVAAGEVLCRTLELGVCGTDREILLSSAPLVPEGSDYLILGTSVWGGLRRSERESVSWRWGSLWCRSCGGRGPPG